MDTKNRALIHFVQFFDAAGLATEGGIHEVEAESSIRTVIENVGPGNVVEVQAKLKKEGNWNTISTITGESEAASNVSTYDLVRFMVTSYEANGRPKIIVSGFSY